MTCILPSDLVEEVLLKLPVEVVSRLRWVSKSWKTLIENPEFIKLHLKTSSTRSFVSHVIDMSGKFPNVKLCVMDCLEESPNRMRATAKFYCPSLESKWHMYIKGVCNGLICVLHKGSKPNMFQVALWNPKTHRILQLPSDVEHISDNMMSFNTFGFGYDVGHDDYKVVSLVKFDHPKHLAQGLDVVGFLWKLRLKVYSLNSNCWKFMEFPYYVNMICMSSVSANGALHWCRYNDNAIIAFNLTTEKYHLIDFYINPKEKVLHFGLFDDCLCLSISTPVIGNVTYPEVADFLIMKEYGVKDSWTRLTFKRPPPYPGICYKSYDWMPVSFDNNNKYILFQNDRFLTLYDTENKVYDDVVVIDDLSTYEIMQGYTFIPSLVNLPGAIADTLLIAPWKRKTEHPRFRFRSLLPNCLFPQRNQSYIE